MSLRYSFVALALSLPLVLAAAPAAADLAGCGRVVVSDSATLWTDAGATGAGGVLFPAAAVTVNANWALIPGATPIWKSSGANQAPTLAPVTFTRTFAGCTSVPPVGSLTITGDDSYAAFVNGAPVAACGTGPLYHPPVVAACHTYAQTVSVPIAAQNVLVIEAWNIVNPNEGPLVPNPAQVQFSLSY